MQLGGARGCLEEREVELYVFGHSVKMQEWPFCANEMCKKLMGGEGWRADCRVPLHLKESNIKKGCKTPQLS